MWMSFPGRITAEQAEHEEHRREEALAERVVVVRVAQPLPLEVQPPHADLRRIRRLPLAQLGLAVLAAIEVVHERVVRALAEGARRRELDAARRRLALVERREMRRPDRLHGERRDAEAHRADPAEDQLP